MRVKVGNRIYDGLEEPVMVILTKVDKQRISEMAKEDTRYCCFPNEMSPGEIDLWMKADFAAEQPKGG